MRPSLFLEKSSSKPAHSHVASHEHEYDYNILVSFLGPVWGRAECIYTYLGSPTV